MLTLSCDEREGMILGDIKSRGDERCGREGISEGDEGEGWILGGIKSRGEKRCKRGWISEDEKGIRDVILENLGGFGQRKYRLMECVKGHLSTKLEDVNPR